METQEFFNAIRGGDLEKVMQAVNHERQWLSARDENGLSAVMTSVYSHQPAVTHFLVQAGAPLDLFEASAAGVEEHVRSAIKRGEAGINDYAADGFHPLGLAAFFGHAGIVEYLLEKGADVHATSRNPMKVTALHSAAAGDHLDVARVLLDYEADPDVLQQGGFTPLHAAAQNGSLEMVRMLLAYGADASISSDDGRTPLDIARESRYDELMETLTGQAGQ